MTITTRELSEAEVKHLEDLNRRMDELDAQRLARTKAYEDTPLAIRQENSFEVEKLSNAQKKVLGALQRSGHYPASILLKHWKTKKPIHELTFYLSEIQQAKLLLHAINPNVQPPDEISGDVTNLRDELFELLQNSKKAPAIAHEVLYGKSKEGTRGNNKKYSKRTNTRTTESSFDVRVNVLKHLAKRNLIAAQSLLDHIHTLPPVQRNEIPFIPPKVPGHKSVAFLAKLLGLMKAAGHQPPEMKQLAENVRAALKGHELEDASRQSCALLYRIKTEE